MDSQKRENNYWAKIQEKNEIWRGSLVCGFAFALEASTNTEQTAQDDEAW